MGGTIHPGWVAFRDIPEGVADSFGEGIDIVGTTVSKVSDMISSNWLLWLALAFGILTFSINIFRKLRKRK